jgi:hypothetical protein
MAHNFVLIALNLSLVSNLFFLINHSLSFSVFWYNNISNADHEISLNLWLYNC